MRHPSPFYGEGEAETRFREPVEGGEARAQDAYAVSNSVFSPMPTKTRAPFWKKETGAAGPRWVDAREADDRAAERWRSGRSG